MWKARPIVASRVGGIQDQLVDERDALLIGPYDLDAWRRRSTSSATDISPNMSSSSRLST
jgi:trehalose synthase